MNRNQPLGLKVLHGVPYMCGDEPPAPHYAVCDGPRSLHVWG